jgi:hypothetical protein
MSEMPRAGSIRMREKGLLINVIRTDGLLSTTRPVGWDQAAEYAHRFFHPAIIATSRPDCDSLSTFHRLMRTNL